MTRGPNIVLQPSEQQPPASSVITTREGLSLSRMRMGRTRRIVLLCEMSIDRLLCGAGRGIDMYRDLLHLLGRVLWGGILSFTYSTRRSTTLSGERNNIINGYSRRRGLGSRYGSSSSIAVDMVVIIILFYIVGR